jgi:hypothetical protein
MYQLEKIIREEVNKLIKEEIYLEYIDISDFGINIPKDIETYINLIGKISVNRIKGINGDYRGLKNWLQNTFLKTSYIKQDGKLYPFRNSKKEEKFTIYENGKLKYILSDKVQERRTYNFSGKLMSIKNNYGTTFYKNSENKTIILKDFSDDIQEIYYLNEQPIKIIKNNVVVKREYDSINRIIKVEKNNKIETFKYKNVDDLLYKYSTILINDKVKKTCSIYDNNLLKSFSDFQNSSKNFELEYNNDNGLEIIKNKEIVFKI